MYERIRTEKEEKEKKKREEMRVIGEREGERGELIKQTVKMNKILVFCFTIKL